MKNKSINSEDLDKLFKLGEINKEVRECYMNGPASNNGHKEIVRKLQDIFLENVINFIEEVEPKQ